MIIKDLAVDWKWVTDSLEKKERISPSSPDAVTDCARSSIERAKALAEPAAILLMKPIKLSVGGYTELRDGERLSGKAISEYLKEAAEAHLFLVTIGPSIEDEASKIMKDGDSLSGYLFDRIGSFAVESLAESLECRLRKECEAKGKSASMRLSPGYCDWPVEEQRKMDAMLDFSRINVRITESCMMIPKKSISGLIGVGARELFLKRRSQCSICSMKNCSYRRI